MEKYKFLFKPLFFIFSLLFACWMVLKIEQIQPSDFGRYEALFKSGAGKEYKPQPVPIPQPHVNKDIIKKGKEAVARLFSEYKSGRIDSVSFNHRLEKLLETLHQK